MSLLTGYLLFLCGFVVGGIAMTVLIGMFVVGDDEPESATCIGCRRAVRSTDMPRWARKYAAQPIGVCNACADVVDEWDLRTAAHVRLGAMSEPAPGQADATAIVRPVFRGAGGCQGHTPGGRHE